MEKKPVNSSNLKSVGYDNGTLEVEFKSGDVYSYSNVPESTYNELMKSSSLGSFFSKNIRNNFSASKVKS